MTYQLIHGDCLEEMAKLEPSSVDLILTDPPYGTTACAWDTIIPFDPMWQAIKRVRKPRAAVVLFGSEPFSSMLRVSNLKEYKYDWVWDKVMVSNVTNAKTQPLRNNENILVFSGGGEVYNPQLTGDAQKPFGKLSATNTLTFSNGILGTDYLTGVGYPKSIIQFARPNNLTGGGFHTTQKPVALLEYLIKTYTNPGAVVLDFTMGSGSTGVAAVKLGRDFIGIDNGYCEKEGSEWYGRPWVDVARHRIANAAGDFVLSESERKTGQLALFEEIQ